MPIASLLLVTVAAHGGTDAQVEFRRRPLVGHPVFDLRVGVGSTAPLSRPYFCAEGAPLAWLTLEACGSGSGILHQGDEPDMAHFRTRLRVLSRETGRMDGQVQLGVGFAEVQRTVDAPGFRFGEPREREPVEAAGPEASVGVKGRYWTHARTYLTVDATAGVAHIQGAPAVLPTLSGPVVPFASVTAGVGF